MKFRIAKIILFNNGYNQISYSKSDHIKFYNKKGKHISIPYHKDINEIVWKRLVKENNLII